MILPQLHKLYRLAFVLSLHFLLISQSLFAGEGMWMPTDLKRKEAVMKEMGLQLPVEKIFNNQGNGLNEAVVWFDRGCTGEIISNKGLLLTNHHCGYRPVQALSAPGKDYFANGFWAMNSAQELPCPGLTITIVSDLQEVTPHILSGIDDKMPQKRRDSVIAIRIKNLEKGYKETGVKEVSIRPFFQGNQYWAIIAQTFKDIRLVGFPPNGIGSFGGDTDNWMWPRHTGDFSLFRIYAGKGNQPAEYSASNKPYVPKKFLTINAGGIKEGDFTMVYGFPGSTQQYISSYQLNNIYSVIDPIRIEARTAKLDVWKKAMAQDRKVFLQYTGKKASVANGWKKWQGEVRGLRINNVVQKKRAYEQQFIRWSKADKARRGEHILETIQANNDKAQEAIKTNEYYNEAVMGIELINFAAAMSNQMGNISKAGDEAARQKARLAATKFADAFYKDFHAPLDQELFTVLMPLYVRNNASFVPSEVKKALKKFDNDYQAWAATIYENSLLTHPHRLKDLLTNGSPAALVGMANDPAMALYQSFADMRREKITPVLSHYQEQMPALNRQYMKAQMELNQQKDFYPDANSTLRVSFGQVKGIDPDGPAVYAFQTFLSEAVQKHNAAVEEFNMPQKLIDLYHKKDFGRWKQGNDVPIAFLAQNHTTGGNSGSPVLNAKGELIGTNFDRIWEGTMSDLYYDPNLCRNISVDIRYTLFVIEKFGGASWLLKEMKIVR